MKIETMTTKLFSLSCENQAGVLTRIVGTLTRPGYQIATFSQSRTDVTEIVLLTIEVALPAGAVDTMIRRMSRIIGVLDVTASFSSVLNSAIYRVSTSTAPAIWEILHRHHAQAIADSDGHLLVHQVAKANDIQRLYNELDGPSLVGFSCLPLAISQPLSWEEVKGSLETTPAIKQNIPS